MLRVIYDDDDDCIMHVTLGYRDFCKALLDLYILGDKYDVPVLRHQAKDQFMSNIRTVTSMPRDLPGEQQSGLDDMFEQAARSIARLLGPSAVTFADKSVQEDTLEWCAENLDDLLWHRAFRKLLGKGRMLSTEFAGRLLLMKARLEGVEFGSDLDKDVYDHSSELSEGDGDGDGNEHESESEIEAEEAEGSVTSVSVPEDD
ncbi:unnamed protein product [Aureobasidium mustum]|uniref:Uncharacterized protein n=1 Tax=Aureobasidium mustum TaxID=2773714 RepID=A0A9N8PNP6_9PEZI|nr:unnamed protein product [Aureobasidium mustum]